MPDYAQTSALCLCLDHPNAYMRDSGWSPKPYILSGEVVALAVDIYILCDVCVVCGSYRINT